MSEAPVITPAGWNAEAAPFHSAEIAVQQRAGVEQDADRIGRRGIRRSMPEQHRAFFAEQPFMVFGGVDASGQPWATLRVGKPGFVSSPDAHTLRIAGGALPGDPLAASWREGAMIGGLGLQPETRRRNRVNGVVSSVNGDLISLDVLQSFGNCAKYIQARAPEFVARDASTVPGELDSATRLNDADRALLSRADTFFIASANLSRSAKLARGADVSHRGGMPGFVRVDNSTTLTTPDFSGNRFFNTLGNLTHDPRAGLLFVDFASGDLLYIAALAEIIWDGPQLAQFPLAERLVRFRITEVRRGHGVLPFRWSTVKYAPQFAALTTASEPAVPAWRALRVAEIRDETPSIRSFHLESADGSPLPAFKAGQYLPIHVPAAGKAAAPLLRTYTVSDASDAANPQRYRISVKRQGAASNWLHDQLTVGATVKTMAPRGVFTFDQTSTRPAVFVSAGIGITPMVAMLHHALADGAQSRPLHFFHGARNESERPFGAHLRELARRHANLALHLFDSDGNAPLRNQRGRVDIAALKRLLPFDDYDFYLCGPYAFMRDVYEGLRALHVADERIRFEAFGPASVKRKPASSEATAAQPKDGVPVTFARSERTVQWLPKDGTLLEFAQACGINAASSCRSGLCGTCSTRVLNGKVMYEDPIEADVAPDHALICMGRPLEKGSEAAQPLTLDL